MNTQGRTLKTRKQRIAELEQNLARSEGQRQELVRHLHAQAELIDSLFKKLERRRATEAAC